MENRHRWNYQVTFKADTVYPLEESTVNAENISLNGIFFDTIM